MAQIPPPPLASPIAQGRREVLHSDYQRWFLDNVVTVLTNTTTVFTAAIDLTNQNASIGTTNVPLAALSSGFYRVNYYARITTVDPVSSSLIVTVGWTESAVSLTSSGAALTGNTTVTVQGGVVVIEADQATPISYATTYVSNTPGAMKYRLSLRVEAL